MMELLRPKDKLILVHIYNKTKTYLPPELQEEGLRKKYTDLLSSYPADKYSLVWKSYDPKINLKYQLVDICIGEKTSLLGLGYFGLKGSKKTNDISTAVEIASVNSIVPLLIVITLASQKNPLREKQKRMEGFIGCAALMAARPHMMH